MIRFVIPIRTISPNRVRGNTRLAAIITANRKKKEREVARLCTGDAIYRHNWNNSATKRDDHFNGPPCATTLTRVSAGTLDTDNLASSLKACRDGIADALGVDDGSNAVEWKYGQRKGARGSYSVEVEIA